MSKGIVHSDLHKLARGEGKHVRDSHGRAEFSMVGEEMRHKRITCLVRDAHMDAQHRFHDQVRWCILYVLGRASRSGWASRTQYQFCSRGELKKCLMPSLPNACSTCALKTLASELFGQDAASPATTGDPPPLLRPKSQAGWTSQA